MPVEDCTVELDGNQVMVGIPQTFELDHSSLHDWARNEIAMHVETDEDTSIFMRPWIFDHNWSIIRSAQPSSSALAMKGRGSSISLSLRTLPWFLPNISLHHSTLTLIPIWNINDTPLSLRYSPYANWRSRSMQSSPPHSIWHTQRASSNTADYVSMALWILINSNCMKESSPIGAWWWVNRAACTDSCIVWRRIEDHGEASNHAYQLVCHGTCNVAHNAQMRWNALFRRNRATCVLEILLGFVAFADTVSGLCVWRQKEDGQRGTAYADQKYPDSQTSRFVVDGISTTCMNHFYIAKCDSQ